MSTTEEKYARKRTVAAQESTGRCGAKIIGTGATAGRFVAIQCLDDANLTTVGNPALTTIAIKAGTVIYGNFTSATSSAANKFLGYQSCD